MNLDAKDFIPENLESNEVMLKIIDMLNVLVSKEQPTFEIINNAYNDSVYKIRNFDNVSYEAKLEIIKELGFEYITNILPLTNEQLTQLLIFFNLIYILKGKEEGLRLILDTMNLVYTYTVWDTTEPTGVPLTAKLDVILGQGEDVNLVAKLLDFVRSYMLVYIDITIKLTIEAPPIYVWAQDTGFSRIRIREPFEATGDPTKIAVYDIDNYDEELYGYANIHFTIYTVKIKINPVKYDKIIAVIQSQTYTIEPNGKPIELNLTQTEADYLSIIVRSEHQLYESFEENIQIYKDLNYDITLEYYKAYYGNSVDGQLYGSNNLSIEDTNQIDTQGFIDFMEHTFTDDWTIQASSPLESQLMIWQNPPSYATENANNLKNLTNPGTYTYQLNNYGDYIIDLVGAGGGTWQTDGGVDGYNDTAWAHHYGHDAGSGAYIKIFATLPPGKLVITVPPAQGARSGANGAAATAIFTPIGGSSVTIARANGGNTGKVPTPTYHAAATGGTYSYNSKYVREVIIGRNGNAGYVRYSQFK